MKDIREMGEFNIVYNKFFERSEHLPARTLIQVANTPLQGARVEVDAIAVLKN